MSKRATRRGTTLRAALICTAAALLPVKAVACNVALALTVDVSASISPTEYLLQMNGLADALEDPEVSSAIIANQAALSLVQWSGAGRQTVSLRWRRMGTEADLVSFARDVRQTGRVWSVFSTAIGDALMYTARTFEEVSDCERYVIDVSGDGLSNEGVDVELARDTVVAAGITVNGLAIETSILHLEDYFHRRVVGGPGAFVERAANYDDYGRAIRQKLLAEIIKPAF